MIFFLIIRKKCIKKRFNTWSVWRRTNSNLADINLCLSHTGNKNKDLLRKNIWIAIFNHNRLFLDSCASWRRQSCWSPWCQPSDLVWSTGTHMSGGMLSWPSLQFTKILIFSFLMPQNLLPISWMANRLVFVF